MSIAAEIAMTGIHPDRDPQGKYPSGKRGLRRMTRRATRRVLADPRRREEV